MMRQRITLGLIATGLAFAACRSSSPPTAHELALEGTERLNAVVQDVVPDDARAARAKVVLDSFQDAEEAYFQSFLEHRSRLDELNADHGASEEQFHELYRVANLKRREFKDVTVKAFGDLREELEPEEWKAVFDEMKVMDEAWEELAQ